MLNQNQIMPLLIEACPSFRAVWDEIDEEDRPLIYVSLGSFARHLLDSWRLGRTAEIAAVVKVIERLHLEGDAATKEAATIGLLEAVQNVWSHAGEATDEFVAMLLPQSRRWWRELELFWAGEIAYVGANLQSDRNSGEQ